MELLSFGQEILQSVAEAASSYKLGQAVLRHVDRALSVLEKCARWAVPPPLDVDERPQPELIRPLPWVFFLSLLLVLRITRESISLVNLAFGKPPLRSADVVLYIQSKRRYLRALKYQGTRIMRNRTNPTSNQQSWYSSMQSLMQVTMCFRRPVPHNNNTQTDNNEEMLVIKRHKKGNHQNANAAAATLASCASTMDRLIEKMMVDLDAESDDDSSFTLTNATSFKSEDSECESEQSMHASSPTNVETSQLVMDTPPKSDQSCTSTPKVSTPNSYSTPEKPNLVEEISIKTPTKDPKEQALDKDSPPKLNHNSSPKKDLTPKEMLTNEFKGKPKENKELSPKESTQKFLQNEKCSPPKKELKMVNGRAGKNTIKKEGIQADRRESDIPVVRITAAEHNVARGKENHRLTYSKNSALQIPKRKAVLTSSSEIQDLPHDDDVPFSPHTRPNMDGLSHADGYELPPALRAVD